VLDPTVNNKIASLFPNPFLLTYVVTLAAHQLSTDLHVVNTSPSESLEFQALLHNYILAPADELFVTPLQGLSYYDKTEGTDEARATPKTETRTEVDVKFFTDSVYENAPQRYRISWSDGSLEIRAKEFKDVVLWNPQEEGRKLADMENEGW
jgi:glucose-6-phosphate 1-epimerase